MPVQIALTTCLVPPATFFLRSTVSPKLVVVLVFSGELHSEMVRQRVTFDHRAGKRHYHVSLIFLNNSWNHSTDKSKSQFFTCVIYFAFEIHSTGSWRDIFFEISDSKAPLYYTVLRCPSSDFQWYQNAWPWMTSERDSRCFVLVLALDAFTSTRLPRLAYINVPLSTYCKIRYVSKFTAASRGSPCDSTTFLFWYLSWYCEFQIQGK